MHTSIIKEPITEPITLQEIKDYLQIEHDVEDGLLQHLIKTARQFVEKYVNRAFITQTRCLTISYTDGRKKRYFLGSAPFLNLEGPALLNNEPFNDFHLIRGMGHAMLCLYRPLAEGETLRITFNCGYGDSAENVPAIFRHAILIKVAQLYKNRSGTAKAEDSSLKDLLAQYQYLRLM